MRCSAGTGADPVGAVTAVAAGAAAGGAGAAALLLTFMSAEGLDEDLLLELLLLADELLLLLDDDLRTSPDTARSTEDLRSAIEGINVVFIRFCFAIARFEATQSTREKIQTYQPCREGSWDQSLRTLMQTAQGF